MQPVAMSHVAQVLSIRPEDRVLLAPCDGLSSDCHTALPGVKLAETPL